MGSNSEYKRGKVDGDHVWEPVVSCNGLLARQGSGGYWSVAGVQNKEGTGEEEGLLLWIGYRISFITERTRRGFLCLNGISWVKLDLLKTFQFIEITC